MAVILQHSFFTWILINLKFNISIKISLVFVTSRSNWQYVSIDSGHVLVPSKQQTIIYSKVHQDIFTTYDIPSCNGLK